MIRGVVGILFLAICIVLLGVIVARLTRFFLESGIADKFYRIFNEDEEE